VLPVAATAFDDNNRLADPATGAELADTVAGFVHSLQVLAPA
jgi:hypothetical protein